MHCKELICRRFTPNRVQNGYAMSCTPGFCELFLGKRRCLLWRSLIVLIKLIFNISKRFLNYLQIPGYLYVSSKL